MLVGLVGLALLAAAPAASADSTVETSALRATVKDSPFAIELTDRTDGDVMRTLTAGGRDGGLAYGFDIRIPLVNNAFFGYLIQARLDTLWFRATGVRLRPPRRRSAGPRPDDRRPARPPARGDAGPRGGGRDRADGAARTGIGPARRPRPLVDERQFRGRGR